VVFGDELLLVAYTTATTIAAKTTRPRNDRFISKAM
jgi:hypothetical protein